jgi:hypothetical protein
MRAFKARILYTGKDVRKNVFVVISGSKIYEITNKKP